MNNLPENWIKCTLGDIIRIRNGYAFTKNVFINKENVGETAVPLIKQTQLSGDTIDLSDCVYVDSKYLREKEEFIISYGDILIGLSGSIMKWCIYDKPFPALQNQRTGCIKKSNKDKNIKYILFYLRHISNDIIEQSKGIGILNISTSTIEKNTFPLPPLAEQGRIVAKIEELFAGIDAGVENLKFVKNQIALYRQSVLKSVLSGLATDTLSNHVDMCLGKMLDKEKNKGTLYPYLRNKNVRWVNFELDDLLEMRFEESEEERYSIQRGDLVVCEGGEPGRCAVWENDNVIKFQKALHRLRPHDNMNVYFLMYVFMLNIQAKNWDQFFTGSTIKHLTGEALKNLQIPVPTLAEQERIVAEIESRFERADALESVVDRALNDAEKLKQAVLKKAFAGELVPQNPDDEPASVLLERIRAARASEPPVKKGKRKKTGIDSQL